MNEMTILSAFRCVLAELRWFPGREQPIPGRDQPVVEINPSRVEFNLSQVDINQSQMPATGILDCFITIHYTSQYIGRFVGEQGDDQRD